MPAFSKRSLERLATCHPDLQRIAHALIKKIDFTVLCGHRGQFDQQEAFKAGASKLQWPNSRHNSVPSDAIDIAPWPLDWSDEQGFRKLAALFIAEAKNLGIDIEWGGYWPMVDMPHFQLKRHAED